MVPTSSFDLVGFGAERNHQKTLPTPTSTYIRKHQPYPQVRNALAKLISCGCESPRKKQNNNKKKHLGRDDVEKETSVLGPVAQLRLISGDELVDVVEVVLGLRVLVELLLNLLRSSSPVGGRTSRAKRKDKMKERERKRKERKKKPRKCLNIAYPGFRKTRENGLDHQPKALLNCCCSTAPYPPFPRQTTTRNNSN